MLYSIDNKSSLDKTQYTVLLDHIIFRYINPELMTLLKRISKNHWNGTV